MELLHFPGVAHREHPGDVAGAALLLRLGDLEVHQFVEAQTKRGTGDIAKMLAMGDTWEVK